MSERRIDRTDADQVLAELRAGNDRFASGASRTSFAAENRLRLAREGQAPLAAVVGCSDSRVPVEIIFDAQPGDLFVVRTAGHVLAAASLASLRFAVESLGVRLIVVLGHEECGAVKAVLAGEVPAWLEPISSHIRAPLQLGQNGSGAQGSAPLTDAIDAHVRETCDELRAYFDAEGLGDASPRITGATYGLESGKVRWL